MICNYFNTCIILLLQNLCESIDSVKLHEMFESFGNILSSKVATSEDGKSKGYGFVQFELGSSADAAIEKLNGSSVDGKQMYVFSWLQPYSFVFLRHVIIPLLIYHEHFQFF